jgi:hypothetical protein
MVSPEMPTGGAVGEAVLHDQAHRQADNAMGVVGLRNCQVGHIGVEKLATLAAVVLRVGEVNIAGASGKEISQLMERALVRAASASATLAATRTGSALVDATASHDLGLGQIFHPRDAFRSIRYVLTWSRHEYVLRSMPEKGEPIDFQKVNTPPPLGGGVFTLSNIRIFYGCEWPSGCRN